MEFTVRTTITSDQMATKTVTKSFTAEGFDEIEVVLAPAAADIEVDVCPGAVEGQIKIVQVGEKTGVYPAGLSYKVHEDTAGPVAFTEPHTYLGYQDQISAGAFDKLFFSNAGTGSVTVTVFVARNVVPAP